MLTSDDLYGVYGYRTFEGYVVNKNTMPTRPCDVLCVGTCDIASIRPVDHRVFSWYDIICESFNTQPLGLLLPFQTLVKQVEQYIVTYAPPKVVCLNVPVPALFFEGEKSFGVTKNSKRTIKYLQLKGAIDQTTANTLYELQNLCAIMTEDDVIQYYTHCFKMLRAVIDPCGIQLLWTFNPTSTMESFQKDYQFDCVVKNKGYIGKVYNIDSGPDSSMGSKTQKALAERYTNELLERSLLH